MGLLLPLAMPAYVLAYAWTDALQFSSPLQTGLRAALALARARCGPTSAACGRRRGAVVFACTPTSTC